MHQNWRIRRYKIVQKKKKREHTTKKAMTNANKQRIQRDGNEFIWLVLHQSGTLIDQFGQRHTFWSIEL